MKKEQKKRIGRILFYIHLSVIIATYFGGTIEKLRNVKEIVANISDEIIALVTK
ncbi:MAG: hypothetical protein MK076_11670 [Flavobacteriales bacterium]|nr:hypothetical protein [Flavobacteriales bacterium]